MAEGVLHAHATEGLPVPLFAAAVFASAGLVFLVEPLIGKLLLPSLGGSPAIWNTSLAFFQAALLAGYGYAHALQRAGSVRRQAAIHLVVLALAALVLPLHLSGLLGPPWSGAPALWLVLVLTVSIGPPFAALSASAPLLQAWFARLDGLRPASRDVYRLYAASNLGSVLALAAYPILIEPLMGLGEQARLWSWGYAAFAVLLAAVAASAWRRPESAAAAPAPAFAGPRVTWNDRAVWVLLAAAPSSLLLGVTTHITADVASAPFLWVLPLELYLISFVVAFGDGPRRPSPILLLIQLVSIPFALLLLGDPYTPWPEQVAVHLLAFFTAALICHMTLASRRPPEGRLTEFYLWLSVGGVVGGAFNAFLAPVLFNDVWEYPAVLVLTCLARPGTTAKMEPGRKIWLAAGFLWTVPLMIPQLPMPDALRLALLLVPAVVAVMVRDRPVAVTALMAMLAIASETQSYGRYAERDRSFFGVAHIADLRDPELGRTRIMVHGTTLHGAQSLEPGRRCAPTTYYAPGTAIGQVFQTEEAAKPAMRIAAVGLGVGTVATFVRPADRMRFFEIDPKMVRIALDPRRFTFVKDCARGPVDVVLGDARLSLAREPKVAYDLVLVDAFSSDSVPTHLLTVEAIRLYLSLLKPDGVVLLHLSNRTLALSEPAEASARMAGGVSLLGEHWVDVGRSPYAASPSIALLVARRPESLARYARYAQWAKPQPRGRAWTDDYTNVWGAMIERLKGKY
ncbi:MAG: fused MFS/spermidine synthase [Caulobacteraceae bacterium]